MKSFVIGKLLEPEERTVDTKNGRRYLMSTAILTGRVSVPFDVWQDDESFEKLRGMKDGDLVCAIVGESLDTRGKIRYHLNDVAYCPDEIRESLRDLFSK